MDSILKWLGRRARYFGVVPLVLLCGVAQPALAATRSWVGGTSGYWSQPTNWTPSGIPQNGDNLQIPNAGTPLTAYGSTNDIVNLRLGSFTLVGDNYRIYGNGFVVSNGISARSQILDFYCPITLGAKQQFINPAIIGSFDRITLHSGLELNGFDLEFDFLSAENTLLTIAGVVSGAGNISVYGGELMLGGDTFTNTFSGSIAVTNAEVVGTGWEPFGTGNAGITVADGSLALIHASVATKPLSCYGFGFNLYSSGSSSLGGTISLQTSGTFTNQGTLVLSGPIIGPGRLTLEGETIELTGSANNTFTGGIDCSCGLLRLNKTGGAHACAGTLSLGFALPTTNSVEVRWLGNNQLNGGALRLFGLYDLPLLANLNGFSDTVSSLTVEPGALDTGAGQLTLTGAFSGSALLGNLSVKGFLFLPAGNHAFEVSGPFSDPPVDIQATIHGPGTLDKTGPGTLSLSGASDYTGLTLVEAGMLEANSSSALGTGASGVIVDDGATLWLSAQSGGSLTSQISLTGGGVGGTNGALKVSANIGLQSPSPSIFPALSLSSNTTIEVDSQLNVLGFINGTGSLTKTGLGTLQLAGSAANTYNGDTFINQGTLWLAKSGGAVCIPGNLTIGAGGVLASPSATATCFQNNAIAGTPVTVNGGSLYDLAGFNQSLGQLNLNDGGSVRTGIGVLSFYLGGPSVTVGSQFFLGLLAGASISGRINAPGASLNFHVPAFSAFSFGNSGPELDVPATISAVAAIVKDGSGALRLGGSNALASLVTVNGGRLSVTNANALAGSGNTVFVNSNATLEVDGGLVITNKPLRLDTAASPALDSASGSNTWTGPIILNRDAGISVGPTNGHLQVLNTVSGAGGLAKLGPGTLQFWGFTSNSYAGLTTVSNGVLEAGRVNLISIPGDAVIGDDSNNNVAPILRSLREQQIQPAATVTVQKNGLLDFYQYPGVPAINQQLRVVAGRGQVNLGTNAFLTISNDVPFDFYGAITGVGRLVKTGPGQMTTWGDISTTGTIQSYDGDWKLNGTRRNGGINFNAPARLRGDGSVDGFVNINAGASWLVDSEFPDHQGSVFKCKTLSLFAGSVLQLDLFGPSATGGNDQIVTGTGGFGFINATLQPTFHYPPRQGDVITLINVTNAGSIGTFNGYTQDVMRLVGTVPVVPSYTGGDGNDFTLTVTNLALAYVGYRLAEGNGNQTVEPNECNLLYVTLANRRTNAVTITNAVLRATTAQGVLVTIPVAGYPAIAAGQSAENLTPFQFRTDTNLPCGSSVSFELILGVAGEGPFAIAFSPVSGGDCTHPTGPCESCTLAAGQFDANTPALAQPLYFVGAPSICFPAKACPGPSTTTALTPVRYLAHSFTNSTTNDLCVTVQLDFNCPGASTNALGVAAYLGAFDPTQSCSGYLGDCGVGGPPYPPFSFVVPAQSNFLVVVMARATNLVCNEYALELFGLPCPAPTLAIVSETTPEKVQLNWSTAFPGFNAQQSGTLGGSFDNMQQVPAILGGRYTLTNIPAISNGFYRLKK